MIHKLILVVISILLFNNSIVAQKTTYPIPAQYPNAFIDYIYTANQVKVVTEIYNKNATALSFPANINSPKSNVDLDIYYAEAIYKNSLKSLSYDLNAQYWLNKYNHQNIDKIDAYALKFGLNYSDFSSYFAYSKISNDK